VEKNVTTRLGMDTLTATADDRLNDALLEFALADAAYTAAVKKLATYQRTHPDLRTTIVGLMPVRVGQNAALEQLESELARAQSRRNETLNEWSVLKEEAEQNGAR
jgi:hypothetical protein